MLDFPLMLLVKLPLLDGIHPKSNKFATGVENEATGDSKLNDSPVHVLKKHVHSQGARTSSVSVCMFEI